MKKIKRKANRADDLIGEEEEGTYPDDGSGNT
jgi:hypothetical protein